MADTEKLTQAEEKFFTTKGEEAPDAGTTDVQSTPTKDGGDVSGSGPADAKADAGAAKKEAREPTTVPQQALHEERERRRAAQKEAEDERLKFTKLQSRLDTLTELARSVPQPSPPEVVLPDINADPVGHFRAKTEILERELQENRRWREGQDQRTAAFNNAQRITQIAQAHESEYRKTTPDYDAASTYLRNMRDAQLQAYGMTDPAERLNTIAGDALTIAAQALASNKNPAAVYYELAKASGYTEPKPNAMAPQNGAARPANGGPTEGEKLTMAAKGQQAGASLGQINGSVTPPTTLEALLKMDDEEFADATKGNKWRKLFASG